MNKNLELLSFVALERDKEERKTIITAITTYSVESHEEERKARIEKKKKEMESLLAACLENPARTNHMEKNDRLEFRTYLDMKLEEVEEEIEAV